MGLLDTFKAKIEERNIKRKKEKEEKEYTDNAKSLAETYRINILDEISRNEKSFNMNSQQYKNLKYLERTKDTSSVAFASWNKKYLQELLVNPKKMAILQEDYRQHAMLAQHRMESGKLTLTFIRPNTIQDDMERHRIVEEFAKKVEDVDKTDELDLRFHATTIMATKQIIESGGLISSVDRLNGLFVSTNHDNQISASDIHHIQYSVERWLDVKPTESLPCGCMFVLQPLTQEEANYTIEYEKQFVTNQKTMHNVYFHEHPEQLVAICTTSETLPMVKDWLKSAGLDENIACTFEQFPSILASKKKDLIPPYKCEARDENIITGVADEVLNGNPIQQISTDKDMQEQDKNQHHQEDNISR